MSDKFNRSVTEVSGNKSCCPCPQGEALVQESLDHRMTRAADGKAIDKSTPATTVDHYNKYGEIDTKCDTTSSSDKKLSKCDTTSSSDKKLSKCDTTVSSDKKLSECILQFDTGKTAIDKLNAIE